MKSFNPGSTFTPDPRDAGFAASKHLSFGAGDIFSRSQQWATGDILDQGFSQGCLAFGSVGLLGCQPFSHRGLDPDKLYAEMCAIDGRSHDPVDTGSSVHAALTVLQRQDLIASYLWCTPTEAWEFILDHGPVGFAFPWFDSMELTNDDGTLNVPDKLDPAHILGGHFTYFSGVRADEDTGMHSFRLVNSRGPVWGQGGHAWVPFGAVSRLMTIPGTCLVAPTKTKYTAK